MQDFYHTFLGLSATDTTTARRPVVRVFGRTADGFACCLHVHNVRAAVCCHSRLLSYQVFPYVFIELMPGDASQDVIHTIEELISSQRRSFQDAKAVSHVSGIRRRLPQCIQDGQAREVSARSIYGYEDQPGRFLQVFFYDPWSLATAVKALRTADGPFGQRVFNAHIPYLLQVGSFV